MKEAFRATIKIATEWQNIGALISIPEYTLNAIDLSNKGNGPVSCLRVMLTGWLKRTDPPPSWSELADAVEPFDPSKAEEIRTKYCRFF
jgi:hypothetical protein